VLDLDLNADQQMLRDLVRSLCDDLVPTATVRELEDDPVGIASQLWSQLGELGLCGLLIAEDHGGSAMTLIEGAVLYEELGRALAPVPHFVSCVLAAGALSRGIAEAPSPEQAELLSGIASGERIVTPAWIEPGGGFSPLGVQATAAEDGDFVVLNGSKMHVYFAAAADELLVPARSGPQPTDIDLFLVPVDAPGVSLDQRMSISSDAQYRVDFEDVRLAHASRVGPEGHGWSIWDAVMSEAVVLAAAQAVGGADRALEMTVDYAKSRRQFDKALAEFQSISHYLADAKTSLDGARVLVFEAAWAHSEGLDVDRLGPMSKLFACSMFRDTTAMAQQVFGGIGFTLEYDIQLYFRRAKQLQGMWWDSAHCEDRVAAAILG